jgi:hypothetical protein
MNQDMQKNEGKFKSIAYLLKGDLRWVLRHSSHIHLPEGI